MKKLFLFTFLFIAYFTQAQETQIYIDVQFDKFKNSKDKSIVTGLSPAEVKAKIGNPKAVESGFPDSQAKLISELPDMVGQMNYSSWFYLFDPINLILPASSYIVNGEPADERVYSSYLGKSVIYYVDDKLVSNDLASDYKLTNSTRLKSKPLDRELTKAIDEGTTTIKVIPVYTVIFDKGTQVVANTRAYFMK